MKKIIASFNHHLDDYECMWNGIEDIYMNKTNTHIPNQYFFAMSGFCSFAYIKTDKADMKRMVSFGEGRTKKMYEFLSPIVNFSYHHIESKNPILALEKAKKEINNGYPVVIGAIDMYYLDYYPKLYYKHHIPFHYVLMVGYDDEKECTYIYDCGRKDIIEYSYQNLLKSFNATYPGLCKPNTICTIRMDHPKDKMTIFKEALGYRANMFVNPPRKFLGVEGIKKFVDDLNTLENDIGKKELKKILKNIVEFSGSVPTIPNRLLGIKEKDQVVFKCSRDKMSKVLKEIADEIDNKEIREASKLFDESGKLFEKLNDIFVSYILDEKLELKEAQEILLSIGNLEYQAYNLVLEGIKTI